MKNIAIWIDKKQAKIVSIKDGTNSLDTVTSNVEDFNISGGSGTRFKGGPQDVVQDSKYLEREKHQLAKFFKEINNFIGEGDCVVIFGPAQAGEKLYNELLENKTRLKFKAIAVEKADNMTDNQVIAWAKNYFASL